MFASVSQSESIPSHNPLIKDINHSGNTPLHWAALNGHLEAVKLLVAAGADPSIKNNAGKVAAVEAEEAGKDEVVSWLLSTENLESQSKEEDMEEQDDESAGKEDVEKDAGDDKMEDVEHGIIGGPTER